MVTLQLEVDGKVDDAEVQKQVQKKIWASLKSRGSLRVASQRGVEMGDVAVINFVARNPETNEEMPGSRQVKMHMDTTEEAPFMGMESESPCQPELSHICQLLPCRLWSQNPEAYPV